MLLILSRDLADGDGAALGANVSELLAAPHLEPRAPRQLAGQLLVHDPPARLERALLELALTL